MDFCINCKHFALENSRCESPLRPFDLVWGKQKEMTAEHSRNLAITGCGEDAKWFEFKVEDADLDDLSTIPFGR